jgi:hypothetical protein
MATYIFSAAEHSHLVPYMAALHAACITHDHMIGTFLPPLQHDKLLTWWKDRISEVNSGTRVILLLLAETQPGTRAKGTDLMGVAMLAMPQCETAPFRGYVEKVLINNKCRGQGGATNMMNILEAEAFKRGKSLLASQPSALCCSQFSIINSCFRIDARCRNRYSGRRILQEVGLC